MKEDVIDAWRSYKSFFFSGKVKSHNDSDYMEITVDDLGNFTLLHSQSRRNSKKYSAEQWRIESIKDRKYIYFGKMQAYEIITLEPEDMVLMDVVKGEKLFFAKMPDWQTRIVSVNSSTKQINSEAGIKRQ